MMPRRFNYKNGHASTKPDGLVVAAANLAVVYSLGHSLPAYLF
jgi:hypothetical protein